MSKTRSIVLALALSAVSAFSAASAAQHHARHGKPLLIYLDHYRIDADEFSTSDGKTVASVSGIGLDASGHPLVQSAVEAAVVKKLSTIGKVDMEDSATLEAYSGKSVPFSVTQSLDYLKTVEIVDGLRRDRHATLTTGVTVVLKATARKNGGYELREKWSAKELVALRTFKVFGETLQLPELRMQELKDVIDVENGKAFAAVTFTDLDKSERHGFFAKRGRLDVLVVRVVRQG